MTDRLYYHNSFLYDFVAALEEVRAVEGRTALVLDRTVFYPTSGGQVFDTGWLELEPLEAERGRFLPKLRVTEVADAEDGAILHFIEGPVPEGAVRVRGFVDVERRRDHMQQHSGQHILSAAFVELFQMPTVSFHMGEESCTIDLDAKSPSTEQVRKAEARANEVILEDRAVSVQFVSPEKARKMGVRKIPPAERDELRLVEIKNFDLCACGGTHVRSTGQVGSILCRKVEKAKQGFRVEFVCGERAVRTARRDYETLVESGALFSTHVWEVPGAIRKLLDENKAAGKTQHKLLEEIAELRAAQMIASAEKADRQTVISEVVPDRDLVFVKLLAQKLTQSDRIVALLGAGSGQAALVFAQSPGLPNDMGVLMKEAMAKLGGRGGGNKDLAQGGVPDPAKLEEAVREAATKIK
ncbi:MAG: alanyl-tRNA editing protein [Acidobacteriaceae bacterium]